MATIDYVAPFRPGDDITVIAQSAVTAGRVVRVVAANQVAHTTAASDAWIGVATRTVGPGQPVGITSGGVQEPIASGAVAAGDPVVTAADGKVAKGTSPTAPGYVGTALTSAADAAPLRVKFAR